MKKKTGNIDAIGIKKYCEGRAKKAKRMLNCFYDKHDIEASIGDALADIMHLCEVMNIDFLERYENGRTHFNAEVMGGEHAF